jgi:hypothetical protein
MIAGRTLFVALAAGLTAASTYLAVARWTAGDLLTLAGEVGREEALARRLAVVRPITEAKHRVVDDLVAGRLTLAEAAAVFRELNALVEEGNREEGIAPFRVAKGEEAVWRNVLVWVRAELYQRGAPDADEVLGRLGKEYRDRFGHGPRPLAEYESAL